MAYSAVPFTDWLGRTEFERTLDELDRPAR
jgi:hypothetical protein